MKLFTYLVASSIANLLMVIFFVSIVNFLPQNNQAVLGSEMQAGLATEQVNETTTVVANSESNNSVNNEVVTSSVANSDTGSSDTGNSNGSNSGAGANNQSNTTPTPTVAPTSAPNPTPVPTTQPSKPQCLVKIDGAVYDLQAFRSIHGGGDVFQCGKDMTNVFYSNHTSSYLQIISKYRI